MKHFEQEFYQNFFTFRDEDKMKGIIHLTPLEETQFEPSITQENISTTYVIKKGSRWADLLFTDSSHLGLVASERFRRIFEGYKGINFVPIQIFLKGSHYVSGNYYNIIVSSRCGKIINELSKEVLSTKIAGGPIFTERIGLYFEPDSWDGSDFFTPEGTLNIFITQKIKNLIKENKLTNIKVTSITEVTNYVL